MTYPSFSAGEVLRAADMNAVGLWRVGGGALSGSAVNFVGCFTSDYTDYRIVIDSVSASSSIDVYWQMLDGTTPATTANYSWAMYGLTENNTATNTAVAGGGFGYTGLSTNLASNVLMGGSMDVYGPLLAQRTLCTTDRKSVV
jgi:hypothetical protein